MSGPSTPRPRPDLAGLTAYHTSDDEGARIRLHANENPYPPPPEVMDAIAEEIGRLELNRYPDPTSQQVRDAIADYAGVDGSWVAVGDGSNEVLLQACLAFGGPGRTAMLFEPTYRMHYRQARMTGTDTLAGRRERDFTIDIDGALTTIVDRRPDIVFVCTPNNPTGTVTPPEGIRRIAEAAPGLVIVDEAYHEFCGETFVGDLSHYPNVLVVRTLSKALRLAGARIGYGVADPALLDAIAPVRMPYTQSSPAQAIALVALRHRAALTAAVDEIVAERDRIRGALDDLDGVETFPSGANFVFFRHPEAQRVFEGLGAEGIVIRDFSHLVEGGLRVTAGTPAENDAFCEAITRLTS